MIEHFLFYLCTKFDAFSPKPAIRVIFLHQSTGPVKLNADLGSETEIDFQDIWRRGVGVGWGVEACVLHLFSQFLRN